MRALLVVVLLAACKPPPQVAPFTLRIAVSGPLDRVAPDARSWSVVARALVFERMVTIGQTGELVPALAAKVENAGSQGLRVWLRPGARFSDGTPVAFAHVASSVDQLRLQVLDEGSSLLFRSTDASAPTELLLWQTFVFHRARDRVIGTGAFVVEEEDASHVLLTRRYPAPGFIDKVRLNSYPTPQDAFAHTLKGDADMLPEVDRRWIEFFEGVPRLHILRASGNLANMIAFNPRRLTRQERVALAGIFGRGEVRQLAFGTDCPPPPQRPEVEPLPAGRPLELLTLPLFYRFAAAARRELGARGGAIREVEAQEFLNALRAGDFDLAAIRPVVWPPLMSALVWRTGGESNLLGYSNPAVDAALDARDWKAAQRALDADPPGANVCAAPSVVVLDARIRTPGLEAGGFIEGLPQWEVLQ